MMKWNVSLRVEDGGPAAARSFTVESKSAGMALEKAVQQARSHGLTIVAVGSCNPMEKRPVSRF